MFCKVMIFFHFFWVIETKYQNQYLKEQTASWLIGYLLPSLFESVFLLCEMETIPQIS